jgi:AdoMet-dependent rRNA methyltransferase SPB1
MPAQSLIVGVDLAPIKPIPRVITFQSDITTDKCRATIRGHLKHMKADTVLHDGAPNVGVAWVQDAFSQAELVLQSMKLATEFLKEGGTFVTKVFRSKDYNALLWVFKQLFTSVEATKPPSSRNVSAEIFVVCRGFKAPKRLDPKFLDPKHVFEETQEPTPNNEAKVFNPEKKKRKREGYEEGDWTQHKEVPVSEFIHTTDPIAILGSVNTLSFAQPPNGDLALATIDRLPETTAEIRQCCSDLKVLGKKEFRTLLRWRLKVRDIFGMSSKAKKQLKKDEEEKEAQEGEEVAEVESMDEELKLQEELQRLRDQDSKEKRNQRRKENEKKRKEIVRMQMHMTAPFDIGLEQHGPAGEGSMFSIASANRAKEPTRITSEEMRDDEDAESDVSDAQSDDDDDDEVGDRLEQELDMMYENFQQRREEADAKARAKRARKEKETDDWEGLSDKDAENGDEPTDIETDGEENYTMRDLPKSEGLSNKAAMFFDQEIFQDLGLEDAEDDDNDSAIEMDDSSSDQVKPAVPESKPHKSVSLTKASKTDSVAKPLKSAIKKPQRQGSDSDPDSEPETAPINPSRPEDPLTPSGQLDIDIITAEAMTLAHSLATGEKTARDLEDDTFNKYTFRDVDNLPEWFLDDENAHSKPHRPITKAAALAIKEKLRALNARPIKKVQEAKGRKKFKAAQRLEKLRKKSALLLEDEGVSEKDKASAISRMMARAAKKSGKANKEKVKLVVARGANRGVAGRPRGVKGKYKIVDARLKKDARAEKRLKKKLKK